MEIRNQQNNKNKTKLFCNSLLEAKDSMAINRQQQWKRPNKALYKIRRSTNPLERLKSQFNNEKKIEKIQLQQQNNVEIKEKIIKNENIKNCDEDKNVNKEKNQKEK